MFLSIASDHEASFDIDRNLIKVVDSNKFASEEVSQRWLKEILGDVGFGVLILDSSLRVVFSNRNATSMLESKGVNFALNEPLHPSQLSERHDEFDLRRFLKLANLSIGGERNLVFLGNRAHRLAAAFSPVALGLHGQDRGVLITTERQSLCDSNSLWAYGKMLGLTSGELKVLDHLAEGKDPKNVAETLHVSVTTIRSHIRAIIDKTECTNIRDVLLTISKLPPVQSKFAYGSKH